ncbi:MAG: hypothetical protein WBA42_13245 [Mesorhizobium sp.]
MGERSCIFCGASGHLTNEHVIPVWLQQYVGGGGKGKFRGVHMNAVGMSLSERTASSNSHTLGTVCAACNNGWMSRLESAFRSLLPRLQASMSPSQFSKVERRTIALWIVKTGIVAHFSSNYRPILPPWIPQSLSRGATVPAGIKVFGGYVNSEKTIRWVQSNIGVALVQQSDVSAFETGKSTFVFVLSILNIFIGFGWHGLNRGEFDIVFPGNSVERFYPHPESAKSSRVFEDLLLTTAEIALHRRRTRFPWNSSGKIILTQQ